LIISSISVMFNTIDLGVLDPTWSMALELESGALWIVVLERVVVNDSRHRSLK
jgi:hypothetical protein